AGTGVGDTHGRPAPSHFGLAQLRADLADYSCWLSQGAVVGSARGKRRRVAFAGKRWVAVAAVVVIAAACAVTGLVRWAGTGKPAAAGTQIAAATKARAAGGSADRRQVTGSPAPPGGAPEAGLTAVAAGPVN